MTASPGSPRLLVAAGLALVAGVLVGCAGTPQHAPRTAPSPSLPPPRVDVVPPTHQEVPVPPEGLAPEEFLALPPVPAEMHALADRLTTAFGADPDFGPPEFSLDRTRLTVRWHGPVPAELEQVVHQYADAPFDVVLAPTPFPPGELRDEAGRLVREHAPVVSAAGARGEGDGVFLLVSPDAVAAAGSLDAALAAHGISSRFPLFPEEGGVVPA